MRGCVVVDFDDKAAPAPQVTDGGRNPRHEGLFVGETEAERASRLGQSAPAQDNIEIHRVIRYDDSVKHAYRPPEPAPAQEEREAFEAYMLSIEHPVIGWIHKLWFQRGDTPDTYSNDYVQGAWVIWQSRLAQAEQQPGGWVVIGPDGAWSEVQSSEAHARDLKLDMDNELPPTHEGPAHRIAPVFVGAAPIAQTEQPEQSGFDDKARLDFILEQHRKVIVELKQIRMGAERLEVYVEEGFLGDIRYPTIAFVGAWDGDSAAALETKRRAIDAALSAQGGE